MIQGSHEPLLKKVKAEGNMHYQIHSPEGTWLCVWKSWNRNGNWTSIKRKDSENKSQSVTREAAKEARKKAHGLESQAVFLSPVLLIMSKEKWCVTGVWIAGCHGQFSVIQTRARENLSHQPWSFLFDRMISIGFLRPRFHRILAPTASGERSLTAESSFSPNQGRRCEGKQWGNKLLPSKKKKKKYFRIS